MGKKRIAVPAWWKNTFFWFGGLLAVLAIWGAVTNEDNIRDPGQKFETGLVLLYAVGAVVMLLNGWMTHRQALQHYHEAVGDEEPQAPAESAKVEVE